MLERFIQNANTTIGGSEQTRNGKSKSKLYTPVSNEATASPTNGVPNANHASPSELMQVDDTRDRVYIHDLDAELADDESNDEKLVFLPDIEKRFTKIPQQVLTGRLDDQDHQELVLYGVPKSLTVDEGHDSVRKAIIEARHRATEKAVEEARQADMNRQYDHNEYVPAAETAHGYNTGYEEEYEAQQDPDAMDID